MAVLRGSQASSPLGVGSTAQEIPQEVLCLGVPVGPVRRHGEAMEAEGIRESTNFAAPLAVPVVVARVAAGMGGMAGRETLPVVLTRVLKQFRRQSAEREGLPAVSEQGEAAGTAIIALEQLMSTPPQAPHLEEAAEGEGLG